ncbi:MAG: ABC transporter substrate-binding protein [Pseudomonadales bacterium]|nr:ABC transporter substrate-binding protein [Pseudomonadales bacterium]
MINNVLGCFLKRLKQYIKVSCVFSLLLFAANSGAVNNELLLKKPPPKQLIQALYIPLADHYAAIIAYELFRDQMKHADFRLTQMKNWDLLRSYFETGYSQMAFLMSPLAMDMFHRKENFRWVGLMHRDGNALAINEVINEHVRVPLKRKERIPNRELGDALRHFYAKYNKATYVGVPHLLSTHTVVLYKYLSEQNLGLALLPNAPGEVLALPLAPPKAPLFIKSKNTRAIPAAFEQSLPWADVVETQGYGKVAWYSKDVIKWPKGHVECLIVATDKILDRRPEAVKEVVAAIHQAGEVIEQARYGGGEQLDALIRLIRKHIPLHTEAAIRASLNPELNVINYKDLNIDKPGLSHIMGFALKGGILKNPINVKNFADPRFEDIRPSTFSVEALQK